jgi:hypothetical protein
MFEKELEVYYSVKNELPLGRFVLIHGADLIGVFDTDAQAVAEGARRFGRESFLVRQVREEEPIIFIPSFGVVTE